MMCHNVSPFNYIMLSGLETSSVFQYTNYSV